MLFVRFCVVCKTAPTRVHIWYSVLSILPSSVLFHYFICYNYYYYYSCAWTSLCIPHQLLMGVARAVRARERQKSPILLWLQMAELGNRFVLLSVAGLYYFIHSLRDTSVFSTFEANCGNWQIPIFGSYRNKTCFTAHIGTCRYRPTTFGLRNAPAKFHRELDIIMSGVSWQICRVYLDDVIILSPSVGQHIRDVDDIVGFIKKAAVPLKLEKCAFLK